jgi:hypothetical protein
VLVGGSGGTGGGTAGDTGSGALTSSNARFSLVELVGVVTILVRVSTTDLVPVATGKSGSATSNPGSKRHQSRGQDSLELVEGDSRKGGRLMYDRSLVNLLVNGHSSVDRRWRDGWVVDV